MAVRERLTAARLEAVFDALGTRVRQDGRVLDIAVYGGSALMLVSNFRTSTFDVDAVANDADQAALEDYADEIGRSHGLPHGWLNDHVFPFLSDRVEGIQTEHRLFRSYPDEAQPGLRVFVPTPEYMCALKLMALRIEAGTGAKDLDDLVHLTALLGLKTPDQALALVAQFYSRGEVSGRVENGVRRLYGLLAQSGGPTVATPVYHGRGG